jgi:sugar lactone lactonase YvrE
MKTQKILLVLAAINAAASALMAQNSHTLPANLAAPGTPVLMPRISAPVFAEGVASDWQGNVYFNEMDMNNRTMQVKVGQDSGRIWRQAKDKPNGMWLDTENRIIICQARAIVRVKAGAAFDNKTDTLYKYPATGQEFNDVTGDSRNNLYFTNFNGRSVFYRDAVSGATREVLSNRPKPNGIEWDDERKIVYVCENEAGKLAAYTVAADHSLEGRRDFATVPEADGIVLDSAGNVYAVSYSHGVKVFSPAGDSLGEIPLSDSRLTNLGFGSADFRTLFLITDKGLYKLPMKVKGYKSGAPSVVSLGKSSGPGFGQSAGFSRTKAGYRADGRKNVRRTIPGAAYFASPDPVRPSAGPGTTSPE